MKIFYMFLVISSSLFATVNRISDIKDIYSDVKETIYLNGEQRKKEYNIEYVAQDYLRKEMLLPNVNKGEVFQYENGESYQYIPLFNEVSKNKGEDVSDFLSIINDLKIKDQNDKIFSKNYYDGKVKEIKYKDIYTIKVSQYKKINGYLLPVKMEIFEKNTKVADLNLENTKVNSGLKRKELKK
ncbi:hypothetical protein [Cetobacterium sp.]|uniref:hypothetical protein n=1 Tax=Cetobacterium sp. TaxID=2071632 RepID=UPI003F2FA466